MEKHRKKLGLVLLCIACLVVSMTALIMCFAGCGNEKDNLVDVDDKSGSAITLNHNYYEIEKFDYVELVADTNDTVEWNSSDATVAVVDRYGKVEGLKAGNTVITATVGDVSALCKIVVKDSGLYPSIEVDLDENTNLIKGTSYELSKQLIYNGKIIQNVNFSFESTDQSIVSVTAEGVLTAYEYGSATITVSTNWKGFDEKYTSASVKITVIPDVNLKIVNSADLNLYTIDTLNGEDFKKSERLILELTESGGIVIIDESKVKWEVVDASVASVSEGVITAAGYGKTKVFAEYAYTADGQDVLLKASADVYVERPYVAVEKRIITDTWVDENNERGKYDVSLSAEDIFGDTNQNIVSVRDLDLDREYMLTNGVFAENEEFVLGERRWVVYNENYGYELSALVVSMAISKADDLYLLLDCVKSDKKLTGYYVLTDNINFCGEKFEGGEDFVLRGTFDGSGFAIYNVNIAYGFFTSATVSATIKNVAFVNINASGGMGGLVVRDNEGTIDNVYVQGTLAAEKSTGTFAYRAGTGAKILNSVAVVEHSKLNPTFDTDRSGAFVGVFYKGARIENSYVISKSFASLGVSGTAIALGNVKNSAKATELDDAKKEYNDFVNVTNFNVSQKANALEGQVVLAANVPAVFNAKNLPADVTFSNGVLTLNETGERVVEVEVTYLHDPAIKKTESVKVVKADVKSGPTAYINALNNGKKVKIALDQTIIDVTEVKGIIYEKDLTDVNSDFTADKATNSLAIDEKRLGYGINTIYLFCNGEVYYKTEVLLTVFNLIEVKRVVLTDEADTFEVVFDTKTLNADEISGYSLGIEPVRTRTDFKINADRNSVIIKRDKLSAGNNVLYVFAGGKIFKVGVNESAACVVVNTAAELYSAMQDVTGTNYLLTADIDMSGYKFGANAEKAIKFKGTLDGNGHKVYGISFESNLINGKDGLNGNYVWKTFDGKLCNISFEISVTLKGDENPANNYGWPDSGLIMTPENNTEIDNVYTKVRLDGKNAKYGTSNKLGEAWFFVLGYGSRANSIKVNNVVNDVTFSNTNGVGKAAIVRTLYSVYEITNCFVITNEVNCGIIGMAAGGDLALAVIVKNGDDDVKVYRKNSLYTNMYVYGSVTSFMSTGNYSEYFTHEMWNSIFGRKFGEYDPENGDYCYSDYFKM